MGCVLGWDGDWSRIFIDWGFLCRTWEYILCTTGKTMLIGAFSGIKCSWVGLEKGNWFSMKITFLLIYNYNFSFEARHLYPLCLGL